MLVVQRAKRSGTAPKGAQNATTPAGSGGHGNEEVGYVEDPGRNGLAAHNCGVDTNAIGGIRESCARAQVKCEG